MVNTGDTAWILISAALVMLMTPGLALFYGGMVRRKNVLSTIMMSFALLGLVGVLWLLFGYSLGFAPDLGGFIGKLDFLGLSGVGQEPSDTYATTVPQLAFMIFQAMFAVITVALWTGGVVERTKFSAFLVLAILWFTVVYCPVTHWVWGSGHGGAGVGLVWLQRRKPPFLRWAGCKRLRSHKRLSGSGSLNLDGSKLDISPSVCTGNSYRCRGRTGSGHSRSRVYPPACRNTDRNSGCHKLLLTPAV